MTEKSESTPIWDIDIRKNALNRTIIDRYILISSWCKNKSVLSIGCGFGYCELILKALGAKNIVGIDKDKIAIDYINKNYAPLVKGLQHNIVKNELKLDEKFDVIVAIEIFEHLFPDEIPKFFELIKKCIKDDSTIIISTPQRETEEWIYTGLEHKYEYSFKEFNDIMIKNFPEYKNIQFLLIGEAVLYNDIASVRVNDLKEARTMVTVIQK